MVAGVDINTGNMAGLSEAAEKYGTQFESYQCDVRSEEAVKAVVDALGGVERFAAGGEGSWNYCEFRDTYKKMICKGSPGAAPQLAPVRTKEMTDL